MAWAIYAVLLGLNSLAYRFESLRLPPFKTTVFGHLLPWWALLTLSAVSFLIGFMIYRASLHLHVQFGEVYTSVFDIRRGNVKPEEIVADTLLSRQPYFAKLTPNEKYSAVWNYLQYNLIKCPKCDAYVSAEKIEDPCAKHKV